MDRINEFYANLSSWSKLAKNSNVVETVEHVIRESGFLNALIHSENASKNKFLSNVRFAPLHIIGEFAANEAAPIPTKLANSND